MAHITNSNDIQLITTDEIRYGSPKTKQAIKDLAHLIRMRGRKQLVLVKSVNTMVVDTIDEAGNNVRDRRPIYVPVIRRAK